MYHGYPLPPPELTPEQRKAENARYIAEYTAAWATASPAEREIEILERKDRRSVDEMSRLSALYAQVRKPADMVHSLRDRQAIEDEVERLIGLLDAMDGDADLEEPGDIEPCSEDEGAQCDDEARLIGDELKGAFREIDFLAKAIGLEPYEYMCTNPDAAAA